MQTLTTNVVQNQAFLPISAVFSHLTSVRNPRRSAKQRPSKVTNHYATAMQDQSAVELLCSENMAKTVENLCGEYSRKEFEVLITPKLLQEVALLGSTKGLLASLHQIRNYSSHGFRQKWYESHTSGENFEDNKASRMTYKVSPKVRALLDMSHKLISGGLGLTGSQRGFKTRHSVEKNMIRRTSVTDRLREGFRSRQKSAAVEAESNAKLKNLLAEESSEEGRKILKVAFAEGYLAADPQKSKSRAMRWITSLQQLLGIVVFGAILFALMGSMMGGSMFRVHVGNGSEVHPEEINVTFADVQGVEEAKEELQEIVEFLKNPEKFTALGAELPKGVLLVGPPGTGKTLLARAVAGEAAVPFFHAAGPEFDEILVGQGARRVRDLFRAAKMRAPCVIFIDEIDSVGAKRTNSVLHPYANQTINQLLSEMDGFHKNEGVIVLGATNRRDDLDKALLRPGRFDVEVQVPVPDLAGRKEIFEYYLSKIKVGPDVEVGILARGTTGFTGADIKNVVNQAALRAAADQVDAVSLKHLEAARDKVLMGPEKKSRIPDEEANLVTAYHEGGHTIVAHYTKDSHPLHKVTIIPRGPSLGHVRQPMFLVD